MSPQDIPAAIKSCKAIVDDKERLKCFDGLFSEIPKPRNPPEGAQANWSVDDGTKRRSDGSRSKLREDRRNATRPNETWAMDFVHDQLATGRKLRVPAPCV
jgi:hypothetical protein